MLYDTHAHLDFAPRDELATTLDAARRAGILGWMVPGVTLTANGLDSLRAFPGVSLAAGLHPGFLPSDLGKTARDEALQVLEALAVGADARAIGECGLDARLRVPLPAQVEWFEAQLALARALDLPVLLHQVGARREFLDALERSGARTRGILHGFSGDVGWAKALVKRGLLLGLGPGLLSEKRARLGEVARDLPLEALVLETDLPKDQGHRFTPLALTRVAERLAQLRGAPVEGIAKVTTETALGLFRLPAP